MHDRDFFIPQIFNILRGHLALLVVAGAGAEEIFQTFFRQADACGPRGDMQDFGFVQNILSRFGHSGTVGADHRRYSGDGQLLRGQRRRARVAAVVFHHQFQGVALDASGLVHFVHQQRHHVLHVLALAGPTPGQGTHQADAQRAGHGRNRQQAD